METKGYIKVFCGNSVFGIVLITVLITHNIKRQYGVYRTQSIYTPCSRGVNVGFCLSKTCCDKKHNTNKIRGRLDKFIFRKTDKLILVVILGENFINDCHPVKIQHLQKEVPLLEQLD